VIDAEVLRVDPSGADGPTPRYEQTIWFPGDVFNKVGEIYYSRQLTTSSGIVQSWEEEEEPNAVVAETFAHNVYSLERGEPRRVWRMFYGGIDDDDKRTLDEVRRLAGIQVHPFWFDPPASGNVIDKTIWTAAEGNWLVDSGNTTDTYFPTGADNGTEMIQALNSVGEAWTLRYVLTDPYDLQNRLIEFDLKVITDVWPDANGDLNLILFSGPSTLDKTIIPIGDTREMPAGSAQADQSIINSIGFQMDTTGSTDRGIQAANLGTVDKRRTVKYVELLEYRSNQVSSSPKNRLAWDVEVVVREVLS
jgi:hypothetical protein